jgi:hypothetical protein
MSVTADSSTRNLGRPRLVRAGILRSVDARPLLGEVARCFDEASLEAVLIGNAAAALQGAPVTTVREEPHSRRTRLTALARESDRVTLQMIERWQRRPPTQRTHVLRKRVGPGRTAL